MNDCDVIKAGSDLKALKDNNLLTKKGRAKSTYYIAGKDLNTEAGALSTEASALSTEASALNTEAGALSTEAGALNTEAGVVNTEAPKKYDYDELCEELPEELCEQVRKLKKREKDKNKTRILVKEICLLREYNLAELSVLLKKGDNYLSREFIKPMIDSGEMKYKLPEIIKHPEQAYKTIDKK
jgi:ATP-dependent DNA helicase RecG